MLKASSRMRNPSRPLRSMRPVLTGLAGLLAVLVPAVARADVASVGTVPRAMTLPEALTFARANHRQLRAAKQRVVALERDALVPDARWRPTMGGFAEILGATVNNSSTTLLNNPAVDIPRIGATVIDRTPDMRPYPSTAVAVGVRQQLYDFGRVAAERAAASWLAEVERCRVAREELDVRLAVEQAYFAVRAGAAVEDASRRAYERAVFHRDRARANVSSGMRPPIEATRAEADVARYEAGVMRAQGALHVARSVFAAAVGVDDLELEAADAKVESAPLPPLEEVVRRSSRVPEVQEGRLRVEAQRGETKRLEAQTRPEVFFTASASGRAGGAPPNAGPLPPGSGWVPLVPNYHAGVVMAWPILEPSWSRRAEASRAREQAAESDVELTLRNQRARVSAAWHEARVTEQTLTALERGADAARANYEQAESRFRVGMGTSTELADAQAIRTESDIQLAIGRFERARARAVLERVAAGRP